jgi:DNA repair protein RecO (recombination protein O)
MDWREEGVILSMRTHGESAAIIEVFTRGHGRHAGVVRGGASRRMAAHLQPGTQVMAGWRARLSEHIGAFTVEPLRSRAHAMADRLALAGLTSVCAVLRATLPEREPHPALWDVTLPLLDDLGGGTWPSAYLRWELRLLEELGYGLDLTACAVTGRRDDLAFVSPKTGRAVSRGAAGQWVEKLFHLPAGLTGGAILDQAGLMQGLAITTHFLTRELAEAQGGKPLPEARGRLVDLLNRA